ncbi:hypothetical protein [Streptomyces sp. NBC_00690]|uniref:hypothetical protein n=1 Tax=Streptomyces sp. NBC_00690 TaxID=2975808 RepID=UPI002E2C3A41|nr:hypothetical protein [Streptomyces sp. NBC_00690]
MHPSPGPPLWRKAITRARHIARRTARHRRTATMHMLHGACYGIGTGAVTLIAIWAEQHF